MLVLVLYIVFEAQLNNAWFFFISLLFPLQARSERLASEGVSLRDAAETLQARVEELESENVILMTNLNDVEARLKKCRKIEDLTQMLDIGNLMKSNLAVAQTLDTFMKIVPSKTSE